MPDDLYQDFEESKEQRIRRLNELVKKWDDGGCGWCDEKDAAIKELVDALEHIAEYWNRDQNETAMTDALWHIIETAEEAIAKHKRNEG